MQAEAGTALRVQVPIGNPAKVIHRLAVDQEADLVVIGRGVLKKALGRLRSNAYSIIRESPLLVEPADLVQEHTNSVCAFLRPACARFSPRFWPMTATTATQVEDELRAAPNTPELAFHNTGFRSIAS